MKRKDGKLVHYMEIHNSQQSMDAGEIVYVIYRNPHTQNVANIQEAAVVRDPENPEQLALFLYETYYPLTEEIAVYRTEEDAEQAFAEHFGRSDLKW